MKILVATEKPFAAVAVEGIRKEVEQAGHELVLLEKGTKDDLVKAVADVDGLIVRSDIVDTTVLDAAKNLKVIVRAGAGVDNIDLQAAKAAGICVMNTPGQNSNAVAELVFGMLVMMIRNQFNGTSGTELKGKTLGIHAYGQVGRNVAMQIASMNPVSVSRNDVPKEIVEKEFEIARDKAREEGKPEAMLDKIAEGRLNKFYKESCLLEQEFIMDPALTIEKYLKGVDADLTVTAFKRVNLNVD